MQEVVSVPSHADRGWGEKDACSLSSENYLALRGTNEDDDYDT